MNVLFLSSWLPYPPDNGSKLRVFNLLRGLAQQHTVSLITFVEPNVPGAEAVGSTLANLCHSVEIVPRKPFDPRSGRARWGYFTRSPRSVVDTFASAMSEQIRSAALARPFDVVVASQLGTAVYWRAFPGVPAVFEEVELGLFHGAPMRSRGPWQTLRRHLMLSKLRPFLRRTMDRFAVATVASDVERLLVQRWVHSRTPLTVVPNCVQLDDYAQVDESPQPDTLIFSGALSYSVNHEAMVWFVGDILPRIRAEIPGAHLTITGDPAGRVLPPGAGFTLSGYLHDVRASIARSWVSVAPLRQGGGTRLKILEALAIGTPVVATTKGCEGLGAIDGEHLLIADDPGEFAGAVIGLLRDPDRRARLVAGGRRLVKDNYSWSAVVPRFVELIEQLGQRGARPASSMPPVRHRLGPGAQPR